MRNVLFLTLLCFLLSAVQCRVYHVNLHQRRLSEKEIFGKSSKKWGKGIRKTYNHKNIIQNFGSKSMYNTSVDNVLKSGDTSHTFYYVKVGFGGQYFDLDIDTGSAATHIPLDGCINCYNAVNHFDLEAASENTTVVSCSSTECMSNTCPSDCYSGVCHAESNSCCSYFQPSGCGFAQCYADRSCVYGMLVKSKVTIGAIEESVTFGGVLGDYRVEARHRDGILGLAYKSLSCNPTCIEPIFDKLADSGKIANDMFSICIDDTAGTLTLGGMNANSFEGELRYTPLVGKEEFYVVEVDSVVENTNPIFSNSFKAVVDSGSTLLILSNEMFDNMKQNFSNKYCHIPGLCGTEELENWFDDGRVVALTDEDLQKMPNISFSLRGDIVLTLEPNDYMLKIDLSPYVSVASDVSIRRFGIQKADFSGYDFDAVLGDTFLRKFYTVFDRENRQMGFASKTACAITNIKTSNVVDKQMIIPYKNHTSTPVFMYWIVRGVLLVSVVVIAIMYLRNSDYTSIQ